MSFYNMFHALKSKATISYIKVGSIEACKLLSRDISHFLLAVYVHKSL